MDIYEDILDEELKNPPLLLRGCMDGTVSVVVSADASVRMYPVSSMEDGVFVDSKTFSEISRKAKMFRDRLIANKLQMETQR